MERTDTSPARTSLPSASAAVRAAADALLSVQRADGGWDGELRSSIMPDVEMLLLRRYLQLDDDRLTASTARWIRSQQRPDGTWAKAVDDGPDLSLTVAGYLALRLAGDDPGSPGLVQAREFIVSSGGLGKASMFVRLWLAVFGQVPWTDLPAMPPQLFLAPRWFPLSIYKTASWVRTITVPLMLVTSLRPVGSLGIDVVGELGAVDSPLVPMPARVLGSLRRLPGSKRARREIRSWLVSHQGEDGLWYGSTPPTVWTLVALHAAGLAADDSVVRSGVEALAGSLGVIEGADDTELRRTVMFSGENWDTSLAVIALAEAGVEVPDGALAAAREFLLGNQSLGSGDWQVHRPRLAPGGWSFSRGFRDYPDLDDTSMAVRAIVRVGAQGTVAAEAVQRGVNWCVGMQTGTGGWASFEAAACSGAADKAFAYTIATDRPSAELTAHVLEMLAEQGMADTPAAARGIDYLRRTQEATGSWPGRWMVNHVYGTAAAIGGLLSVGVAPADEAVERAVAWLEAHQNPDGGWGEDLRSLTDPSWIGRGKSTASQTAWALTALVAAGRAATPSATGGVTWLLEHQRQDGTWDEPEFVGWVGGGAAGYIPLRYGLSCLIWPLIALGRYTRQLADGAVPGDTPVR